MKLGLPLSLTLALLASASCKAKNKPAPAVSNDSVPRMTVLRDRMCACKDEACAKQVQDEVTALTDEQAKNQAASKLGEADQKTLMTLGKDIGECFQKATAAPAGSGSATADAPSGSGSATPSEPATSTGLPKECDDYKAAIDKLSTCEKLSKNARETLVKAYGEAAEGWKKLSDPAKEKIKVSCKAATDSVLAVGKTQCGW